jgi:hypothetical protein
MKLFKKLWEKIVINQYISAGLQWGDATSYLPIMGEAVGYDKMESGIAESSTYPTGLVGDPQ